MVNLDDERQLVLRWGICRALETCDPGCEHRGHQDIVVATQFNLCMSSYTICCGQTIDHVRRRIFEMTKTGNANSDATLSLESTFPVTQRACLARNAGKGFVDQSSICPTGPHAPITRTRVKATVVLAVSDDRSRQTRFGKRTSIGRSSYRPVCIASSEGGTRRQRESATRRARGLGQYEMPWRNRRGTRDARSSTDHVAYPKGFANCQCQVSRHISSRPNRASQPSRSRACATSA
jgi:hypothetical protein